MRIPGVDGFAYPRFVGKWFWAGRDRVIQSHPMTTPMMAQWEACKEEAGNALLLFRMGDFYESFHDDAVQLADTLELTLTKRQEIPMAGIPWHSAENYITKLVSKGVRVAIAEQTEDPKKTKGLVKREIVRFVTPGTLEESQKKNTYFVSIAQQGSLFGLAMLDLTTGQFYLCELESGREVEDELAKVGPSELLCPEKLAPLLERVDCPINLRDQWHFDHEIAQEKLLSHFGVATLDGFGLKGQVASVMAAGALLDYVTGELKLDASHVSEIRSYSTLHYMGIDRHTQESLNLPDLLEVIDQTQTAMGGRLLRQWLTHPLNSVERIVKRQESVEKLLYASLPQLKLIRDLERLITRNPGPRDLKAIEQSLEQIPSLKANLAPYGLGQTLEDHHEVVALLRHAMADEPPMRLVDGGVIREGYSADLDELRGLASNAKEWMANYQAKLREELEIKTLKVGYNRVFGYYLEVSKGLANKMPDSFTRRQTLTNAERFISPELKEFEDKILSAEERIKALEEALFEAVRKEVLTHTKKILRTAREIARIDCLAGLAAVAREKGYVRPTLDESKRLQIVDGRHPVVESHARFVPNDCDLQDLVILTGPNMAGKSTYIRQIALITILAQMGSFVPARSAHIGLVDRLFTRIGASDDLARGQSTFMVEMTETANILHNATDRSLVILDEVGRGTSTYDGLSIAWAVAETLRSLQARTLFATHYWELTELDEACNFHVAVQEDQGELLFLHKIQKGAGDKSYGIHVAKLAGLPPLVIARAEQILTQLEAHTAPKPKIKPRHVQLELFD